MTRRHLNSWVEAAARVAAAGFGAAVAGPLGAALGGLVGAAVMEPVAHLIEESAKKFGEKSTEKGVELGVDALMKRLQGDSPDLESVYRESLRLSLKQIQEEARIGYEDWFANWDFCLDGSEPLNLAPVDPRQVATADLDDLFRRTLERLDGEGKATREKNTSLSLACRDMPKLLLSELERRLPAPLEASFRALIVKPEYEEAWKQAQQQFQRAVAGMLRSIKDDTSQLLAGQRISDEKLDLVLQATVAIAENEKRIGRAEARALAAEAAATEWKKKYLEVSESDPSLKELLAQGDFEEAARRKVRQIEGQTSKLGQHFFELGTIYELRFDWPQALKAYREAWRLGQMREYGFRCAYCADHQNDFTEAIGAYEAVRPLYSDDVHYMAGIQNNLGALYYRTGQMEKAEEAYAEALTARRMLAQENEELYLRDVAVTLGNLGVLYSHTERMAEAEDAYREALSVYSRLAKANDEVSVADVAGVLHNLGVLYRATDRPEEAEAAFKEALSMRRAIAEITPEIYQPALAMTLDSIGNLYRSTNRPKEAEEAFDEALAIWRQFAETNAPPYLHDLARTLNNLGILYGHTQRLDRAEEAFREAEEILQPLWSAHPKAHGDLLARTWLLRAFLCETRGADIEALAFARRALDAAPSHVVEDSARRLIDRHAPVDGE